MGGCRCSYKNCIRATKNSERDFHFFHYPVRDPERCSKWITNAKKPNFHELPEEQLRNKVVCQLHFELQYFTNASRKRLVHNAVPSLDAGSEEPKSQEIIVQVLQSDSEGNVFTVDTDNLMQTEIKDVTSYVIKNGNIVPADLSLECEIDKLLDSKRTINLTSGLYTHSDDNLGSRELINKSVSQPLPPCNQPKSPSPTLLAKRDEQWLDLPNRFTTSSEIIQPTYESPEPLENTEKSVSSLTKNNIVRCPKVEIENTIKEAEPDVINMSKTIQRHSQEIASIKRLLSAKAKKSKCKKRLSSLQIMNNLRGLIPPTLCGAVSIHLFKKDCNFNKDENDFLTAVYKASPAAYEVLLKDCKWKLPNSNTVKNISLSKNCVR